MSSFPLMERSSNFMDMRFSLFIYIFLLFNSSLKSQGFFQEVSQQARIADMGNKNQGVCIADYDNDGDEDIYAFTRINENKLFVNQGDGTFLDAAPAMGLNYGRHTSAAAWGDINNDGWMDLYVANYQRRDLLFLNKGPNEQGEIQFDEISIYAGIFNINEPRSVHFTDLDQDGWLDIYVTNYWNENHYYHNNGDLTFTEQNEQLGLKGNLYSMSGLFWDYDRDGDIDVYLVHDFLSPNVLYQNNEGIFEEVAAQVGVQIAAHGMGVDAADINHDGWLDLYITDLDENYLLLNHSGKSFTRIDSEAGVNNTGMGWSCFFLDVDNDGWEDLYVVNDSYFSPEPNVLYRNQGNNTFQSIETGRPVCSHQGGLGGATADFTQNGYPDIIICNNYPGEGNQLFLHEGGPNHWIQVQLVGTQSNRTAIGAIIEITDGEGQRQTQQIVSGSGYASQNSLWPLFGLGPATQVESLIIYWPSGQIDHHSQLAADQRYTFTETPLHSPDEPPLSLLALTPNPIQQTASIRLKIHTPGLLRLSIINSLGQTVSTLYEQAVNSGIFKYDWEGIHLPAGVYQLRCELESHYVHHESFILQSTQ